MHLLQTVLVAIKYAIELDCMYTVCIICTTNNYCNTLSASEMQAFSLASCMPHLCSHLWLPAPLQFKNNLEMCLAYCHKQCMCYTFEQTILAKASEIASLYTCESHAHPKLLISTCLCWKSKRSLIDTHYNSHVIMNWNLGKGMTYFQTI